MLGGGRYDGIGEAFGQARPAIGFSTDLKILVGLGEQPQLKASTGIFAPWNDDAGLRAKVGELREAGNRVVMALPGQAGDARAMGCDRVLVSGGNGWEVERVE